VILASVVRPSFSRLKEPDARLGHGEAAPGMGPAFLFCPPGGRRTQARYSYLVFAGFCRAYCPFPTVLGLCVFQILLATIFTVSAPRTSQKGPNTGTGSRSL
jgi:hypothetical protein